MQTSISVRHLPLITIFFEANELTDLGIKLDIIDVPEELPYTVTDDGEIRYFAFPTTKSYIGYTYDEDNSEQTSKLMVLGLKHAGFNNMLDDYLIRCGVLNIQG